MRIVSILGIMAGLAWAAAWAGQEKAEAALSENTVVAKIEAFECPKGMVGVRTTLGTIDPKEHRFCIDQYEFPNIVGKFPLTRVTWYEAKKYCQEQGKRLCRDKEWMSACRGPERLRYPYGNVYDPKRCATGQKYLAKVGSAPNCRSVYGIYDMVGNVSEWTAGGGVVSFGGHWSSKKSGHCSQWETHNIDGKEKSVGFRCCMDSKE